MIAFIASLQSTDPFVDLGMDAAFGQAAAGTEAAVIAKSTAARGNCPVHIGASESGVNADPLDSVAENLP